MIKKPLTMQAPLQKLQDLLEAGSNYMQSTSEAKLMYKETTHQTHNQKSDLAPLR